LQPPLERLDIIEERSGRVMFETARRRVSNPPTCCEADIAGQKPEQSAG